MLLRGFGKLIAIVVAAGLAGALIGIALAELTGGDDSSTPIASATSTVAPAVTATVAPLTETQTTATQTQTQPTSTTIEPAAPVRGLVPRVEVLSAQIAPLSDDGAKAAAGAVRKALEPGEPASGSLRFTVPSAIAQRIQASGKAQLKIATRTINLRIVSA
jgi:hypothetical protein